MGGAVSKGEDNEELVDNLVEADYVKTPNVECALRAVDRGNYYLEGFRDTAYKDLAWKNGNLHLSAPCIYSEVLECLKLSPGLSFLNLGSGTGYLSTVAGLLLGAYGVNHGVEQHTDVVDYANERLAEFLVNSAAVDLMEFCRPYFVVGNCLQLEPSCSVQAYDRVYCGAAVPPEYLTYVRNLVKVGGIAVMPSGDQLLQIQRVQEDVWETKNILPVSFATLVEPTPEERVRCPTVMLPERVPLKLQEICRETVRSVLRKKVHEDNPDFNIRSVLQTKRRRGSGDCRLNGEGRSGDENAGESRRRRKFIQRILIPVFHADSDDDEPVARAQRQHDVVDDEEDGDDGSGDREGQVDGAVVAMASDDGLHRRMRRPVIAIGTAGISRRSGGRLRMEDLRWNRFFLGGNSRRSSSPEEDSAASGERTQQADDSTVASGKQTTDEDIRDSLDCEQQLLLSGAVDGDGHSANENNEEAAATDGPSKESGTVDKTAQAQSDADSSDDEDDTSAHGTNEKDDPYLENAVASTLCSVAGSTAAGATSSTGTVESSKRSHSESEVPEAEARRKRAAASQMAGGVPPVCHAWRGFSSDGDSDTSDGENEKYRVEQRNARHANVTMQKKFSQTMMKSISILPVPDSMKAYLNYYRNNKD